MTTVSTSAHMNDSTAIHIRDSVYYLSVLATRLQNKSPSRRETTNSQDVHAARVTARSRTLNHLTTCLSRGSKDEESRIVAVTIGPVDVHGVKMSVMGSSSKLSRSDEEGTFHALEIASFIGWRPRQF
ncbi:hypothetical protein B0H19DRAFT_231803 [Mycena capillaripes]|nr:hypothetical protein B0H19DRAFT_231803 [Mycena capillaripes]